MYTIYDKKMYKLEMWGVIIQGSCLANQIIDFELYFHLFRLQYDSIGKWFLYGVYNACVI